MYGVGLGLGLGLGLASGEGTLFVHEPSDGLVIALSATMRGRVGGKAVGV